MKDLDNYAQQIPKKQRRVYASVTRPPFFNSENLFSSLFTKVANKHLMCAPQGQTRHQVDLRNAFIFHAVAMRRTPKLNTALIV